MGNFVGTRAGRIGLALFMIGGVAAIVLGAFRFFGVCKVAHCKAPCGLGVGSKNGILNLAFEHLLGFTRSGSSSRLFVSYVVVAVTKNV